MKFVLSKNPCSSCAGNENERCSLTDYSERYSALNCQLIIDWAAPQTREPKSKPIKRQRLKSIGYHCSYCGGTDVGSRGYRMNKDYRVKTMYCYSPCNRWFSVEVDENNEQLSKTFVKIRGRK